MNENHSIGLLKLLKMTNLEKRYKMTVLAFLSSILYILYKQRGFAFPQSQKVLDETELLIKEISES
jgi:hypothetical protein